MRYDEKSLFPKSILDMEAKMKTTHLLGLRVSRASRRIDPPRIRVQEASNQTRRPSNWNKLIMKRTKNDDD